MKTRLEILAAILSITALSAGCSNFAPFARSESAQERVTYCRIGSAIKYNAPADWQGSLGWRRAPQRGSCQFR